MNVTEPLTDQATAAHTYPVNEIFYSLQGEGVMTGKAAVFIRFSGCNLHCPFCDTDHISLSTPMTAREICETVAGYPGRHIVLTGGEPTMWIDNELIRALRRSIPGCFIQIETNGTIDNIALEMLDWITCSPKTLHRTISGSVDELKVVMLTDEGFSPEPYAELYPEVTARELQPCSCANVAETISYVLENPKWSLSLQTHKMINIR